MTTSPILTAKQLSKTFASRRGEVSALEDITFHVNSGEFLCIVGPSGCGKTTLLRLLAGLIEADEGNVFFEDTPLRAPRPEIGLVFQQANLMPWRTVWDNIRLPLELSGGDEAGLLRAIELVGLAEFSQSYPHELSGGMQQRVAIARALVQQPKILLLDEPFGALDALTRENLNQYLTDLWTATRTTVVMVTHNIREAVFLADRVLVMSQRPGRITATFDVPYPRPRDLSLLYDANFVDTAYQVRQAIK